MNDTLWIGQKCPGCGSGKTEVIDRERYQDLISKDGGREIYIDLSCKECDTRWWEGYTLNSYELYTKDDGIYDDEEVECSTG